jgi:hypothetical protein
VKKTEKNLKNERRMKKYPNDSINFDLEKVGFLVVAFPAKVLRESEIRDVAFGRKEQEPSLHKRKLKSQG